MKIIFNLNSLIIGIAVVGIAIITCCYCNALGVLKENAKGDCIKKAVPFICVNSNLSGWRCCICQQIAVFCMAIVTSCFFEIACRIAGVGGFLDFRPAGAELPMTGSVMLPVTLSHAGMCADGDDYRTGGENRSACLYTDFIAAAPKSRNGIDRNRRPAGSAGQPVFHRGINAGDLPVVLLGCGAVRFIHSCRLHRLRYIDGLHFGIDSCCTVARFIYFYIFFRRHAGNIHCCTCDSIPSCSAVHAVLHGGIYIGKGAVVIAGSGKCGVRRCFFRQHNFQCNLLETACVVGHFIAVALFGKYFQLVVTCCKSFRNSNALCAACAVLCNISVVKNSIAAVAEQDGNIFICSDFCAGIGNLYATACRCGNARLTANIG